LLPSFLSSFSLFLSFCSMQYIEQAFSQPATPVRI
jgi:hypothetical protein